MSDAIDLTGQQLLTDIETDDWSGVEADLDVLSHELLEAVLAHRGDALTRIAKILRRASELHGRRHEGVRGQPDPRTVAARLSAFAKVLGVAQMYRQPENPKELAADRAFQPLLRLLLDNPDGLLGRELAEILDTTAETVARKLPRLRNAGLVDSRRVGRGTVNRATDLTRELLPAAKTVMVRVTAPPAVANRADATAMPKQPVTRSGKLLQEIRERTQAAAALNAAWVMPTPTWAMPTAFDVSAPYTVSLDLSEDAANVTIPVDGKITA